MRLKPAIHIIQIQAYYQLIELSFPFNTEICIIIIIIIIVIIVIIIIVRGKLKTVASFFLAPDAQTSDLLLFEGFCIATFLVSDLANHYQIPS